MTSIDFHVATKCSKEARARSQAGEIPRDDRVNYRERIVLRYCNKAAARVMQFDSSDRERHQLPDNTVVRHAPAAARRQIAGRGQVCASATMRDTQQQQSPGF